ncbi:cardiolipin synthase [Thiomicrorhabdus sp. ZW0627]|uniref:cardiolipin synthase n=1 Tax=Thiomicrorhabdus sp. ZW0627 TaxID=3039774 RepID=UPI0024369C1C|nr:cardiolipin synthase [Thiomicrorhabdus sp. ZW0627]MDG6774398.1 cardiolipin synthase [Thiomicrorhabdus sp. ZW0627]
MTFSINQPLFWLYLFNIFLVIATIIHMLYQRRSPQNLMAWLLTLLLLPIFGVILYVLFGSRKFFNKRNKPAISMRSVSVAEPDNELAFQLDRLLQSNHIAGTTNGNQVSLCHTDVEAYSILMEAIENAQHSIHIQTYIFELDKTGHTILEALIRKAQQGVQVRLLIDAIGSFALYRNSKRLRRLTEAGGRYAFFQPILHSLFKSQLNLRNHRKIYLFDQSVLLTGGMNLSNDYLGTPDTTPKEGRWIDLMFKIEGPTTFHYQNIFNEDWFYTTNERLPSPQPPDNLPTTPGEIMQAVPSGPDINSDALFETLLHSIYLAKESIHIVTPYFIPDSAIMHALLIAIKRGVKVTLITPDTSDHLIFDLGRSSYMRELGEMGGQLFYYQDNMLHAKFIMIDHKTMLIGSANLDYRSLFINHEMVNFIYSEPLIEQMSEWLEKLLANSIPYQPSDNRIRRLLENLTRIVAPIL